ncbi:MAG: hypothetical protein FJX67_11795 [Alphaproteobacteria bacterium]|nr:hypothetical protein [Alphaproteobacteria bacterium]
MLSQFGLTNPRRLLGAIGIAIALVVGLASPFGYALISHDREVEEVDAQARTIAAQLSRFVYGKGDTWRFQELRLRGLIEPGQPDGDVALVRLLEIDGTPFLAIGDAQTTPLITARAPVQDGDRTIAVIEVSESWEQGLVNTILIALITALLAGLILIVTRIGANALRNREIGETAQRERLEREVAGRTREIARRNEQLVVEIRHREETEARLRAARDESRRCGSLGSRPTPRRVRAPAGRGSGRRRARRS